jgi:hypothetical protein
MWQAALNVTILFCMGLLEFFLTSSSITSASKLPAKKKPVAMATIDKEPDDNTSLAIVPVIISANGIPFSTFAFWNLEQL